MGDAVPGRQETLGYEVRKWCEACTEDGIKIIATGFCKDCSEYMCHECCEVHRKPRKLRGHDIVPVGTKCDGIKQTDDITLSAMDGCTEECPFHPEEHIEYFCKTHEQLCCASCSVIDHKVCEDIAYIPDKVTGLTESEDFLQVMTSLKAIEDSLAYNKARVKTNLATTRAIRTNAKKQNANLQREITELAERKKTELDSEADLIFDNDSKKLYELEENCDEVIDDLANLTSKLSVLQESRQLCQLFINLKRAKIEASTLENKVHEIEVLNTIKRYAYVPNAKLVDLKNTLDSMGKLVPEHSQKSFVSHLTDIDVASICDTNPGKFCILGLAVVSEKYIVATDIANTSAKLIDTTQNKLVSTLLLQSTPRDVCKITDSKVVLTLPGSKMLQFLSVSAEGKLNSEREVNVGGQCYGIVCNQKELIVSFIPSFLQTSKIKILDMDGQVLKTLAQKVTGIFRYLALSNDRDTLYVSDPVKSSVTIVSMEGKFLAEYVAENLKTPQGVICTRSGPVFVCGQRSKNLHQISANCESIQVISINAINGLVEPLCVAFCDKQNKLYVGTESSVKVFSVI